MIEYALPEKQFYMSLTEEAHELAANSGWLPVRQEVESTIQRALRYPFGASSIDPFKDTEAGRTARIVHHLSRTGERLLGLPVTVKGTGVNPAYADQITGRRMNLKDQFTLMHEAYSAQQATCPDGIDGILHVNRPLAYIVHPSKRKIDPRPQEWLLMDRVVGGIPVKEQWVVLNNGRTGWAFEQSVYPDLAALATNGLRNSFSQSGLVNFRNVRKRLIDSLRPNTSLYNLRDVTGHNILQQTLPNGSHKYTIIDLQKAT